MSRSAVRIEKGDLDVVSVIFCSSCLITGIDL